MTLLTTRFPVLPAAAIGALALLVAMMALVHPAFSEGVAASCATGRAVEDAANNLGLVSDCDALLVARDTLAGSATLNWSAGTPIGQWVGVTVIGSPLRVTKLTLSRRGLAGEIPAELGSLSTLQSLDLSENQLSGKIPAELGGLTNLVELDLARNQLSGAIPAELGSLSNLQSLDLASNKFSGAIPAKLGSLSNLQSLDLGWNQLSGAIPMELGSLSNLQSLDLASNKLSGAIPAKLGSLSNLQSLDLYRNRLSGAIPAELGGLSKLRSLDLGWNKFSGAIPAKLGSLSNLQSLDLSENLFLSGGIPMELGGLTNLVELDLARNQFSGKIPAELGGLSNLVELDLARNQLSGAIPAKLGGLSNLQSLDLGWNKFSGAIPAKLGSLSNLQSLDLRWNQLSGAIPAELGSLSNLRRLDLSGNQLSGAIPAELGSLSNLVELDLSGNQLSGAIPAELGSLSNLRRLDLSGNQLSGAMPTELGSLSNLVELDLSGNQLSGAIPAELGELARLRRLSLYSNQLTGEIPPELGNLSKLHSLSLSRNQLNGCIPERLRDVAVNDLNSLGLPFCASRSVSVNEGAAAESNVGNPVAATDDSEGDTLTYTLGGADAKLFGIDSSTGQITVGVGTQLDYETKDRYDVTVAATDPSSGASDTITVAIMVTDVRVSEDAAVNAYDANTNEMIDKSEVIDAIRDYFNYEIEKGIVLELIRLYFGPTPTPAVALVLDSEATVTGYWSDGSANVKVTVSLRNAGNLQLSSPVQVAVTCSQDGEAVDDCDGVMRVALPDGFSPGSGALTLQVPKGEVSFEFDYSGDEPTTLEINVAERIVGVDRDVWKCFSDTVDWDGLTPQELVGCAGWHSAEVPIQKWDRASPVKVWASGPESFIGVFKNVLDDLGPVLGLEFEWVSTEAEAEFVADIGYTLEGGAYYADPNEVGVATIGDANEMGELEGSEIRIKDTWGGATFHELPEPTQNFLEHVITHESIHTLSSMGHRTEPDSIMNNNSLQRLELSPMDERLLRLHGHPLVKPGMAMPEIEALIVFNDELIDPQFDADLTKWKLVSNAYSVLRQAESATFKVRSSLPDCNEVFGWADYTIFDLESHSFAWLGIDDGSDSYYVRRSADEYWHRAQGGWSQVTSGRYADAMPGWRSELTDPYTMIEDVLRYAYWADAGLVTGPDGLAVLEFELGTVRGGRLEVVIVLDPETGVISQYSMNWERGVDACGRYSVEAKDGQYYSAFEFPDAVREGSDSLDDCGIEQLGPISGALSLSGTWRRHCGGGTDGYSRIYRFSVDDWSYVRTELTSANSASLYLSPGKGSDELTVDQYAQFIHSTDRGLIWYHWAQSIVPPGEYTVEVVTHGRVLAPFELAIGASETRPPPHSFKSISSGGHHVCVLDSDGVAVCWGSNGYIPPHGAVSILAPSDEKFIDVSGGRYHSCGLKPDGEVVCWGNNDGGELTSPAGEKFVSISSGGSHTCGLRRDGAAVCWGSDHEGEGSPPLDERFVSISSGGLLTCGLRKDGSPVCWGLNQSPGWSSPPAGEKFVSISSGRIHACGLREDGSAVCWGQNTAGQASPPGDERFVAISSGGWHTCGLRSEGIPVCWGEYQDGQTSPPEGETFTSITSGRRHTCALRPDGAPVCWGSSRRGEPSSPFPKVGSDGAATPIQPPTPERFVSVASGRSGACALRSDAAVECWGRDLQPVPAPSRRFASINAGGFHVCGIREDGPLLCWGSNDYSQLSWPGQLDGTELITDTDWVSISSGGFHTCALRSDGTAECWGGRSFGQARGGGRFASISGGGFHTCALHSDGAAECWGHDGFGQSSPPTDERFASISNGWRHTCALREDGTTICWGAGDDAIDFGQASPPPGGGFASISSGVWHTCALREDGSAVCWGADGDALDFGQASPPDESFVSISSGMEHTCGITVEGTLVCWGSHSLRVRPS